MKDMKDIAMLGKVHIDGDEFHQIAKINEFGELVVVSLNIFTGSQTEFMLDAVAAHNLYEALHKFNQGEFEEEMNETP